MRATNHGFTPSEGDGSGSSAPTSVMAGFAEQVPSAESYAMLSSIEMAEVSGFDTVEVMKAWSRQLSQARAQFLRAVLETGMRRSGSAATVRRAPEPTEFSSEEARAAFMWSRRRARDTFELAWDVHERLPMIGEAMMAGALDEYRATAMAQWTRDLEAPHAEYICKQMIPRAGEMTVGALIHEIKRLAIALDPEWAERRYRAAVARRRVVGERTRNGTANVAGVDLPVERAKAGCDRIDSLARSCKAAGDTRPIDHVRADLFLGMIDGTFTGFNEAEIVQYVIAHPVASQEETGPASTGGRPNGAAAAPEHSRPGSNPPGESNGSGAGGTESASGEAGGSEPGSGEPGGQEPGSGEPAGPQPAPVAPSSGAAAASGSAWAVREVRIELATLLVCDEHPIEVPPWGHVSAALGRQLVAAMHAAEWRFVICDDHGRAICSGITTARPASTSAGAGEASRSGHNSGAGAGGLGDGRSGRRSGAGDGPGRRGVVEIQVRASDLSSLDAACAEIGAYPEWSPVIADIAARVNAGNVDADAAAGEARRRAPGAGLRRLVQVRARYCTHPACVVPATACDQDHAVEFAKGGATVADNLHPPCRHDHRLRHEAGWQVRTERDGTTEWTSGLGHTYVSRPPPVIRQSPMPWEMLTVHEPAEPERHADLPEYGRNHPDLMNDDPPPF